MSGEAIDASRAIAPELESVAVTSASRWRCVGYAVARFTAGVLARLRRRMRAVGAASATEEDWRVALHGMRLEDLYLALACDDGLDSAWRAFAREVAPRLCVCAERRKDDALLGIAEEMPGYLAEPVRAEGWQRRIGAYEGLAALLSWILVIMQRRRFDREQQERRARARAAELARSSIVQAPDPRDEAVPAKLLAAAQASFAAMSPRERCAVRWRFADGLAAQTIAQLLAVSEPRVSALLKRACERLREALDRALGAASPARAAQEEDVWELLRQTIAAELAAPSRALEREEPR